MVLIIRVLPVNLLPTLLRWGQNLRRSHALPCPVLTVAAPGRSHSNNIRRYLRPGRGGVVCFRWRAPGSAALQGRIEDSFAVYVRLREVSNTQLAQ